MSKTICIDPGHGGSDPGADSGSRWECSDTLRISLAVAKLIEAQGHKAVLTHTGLAKATKLELADRRKLAANWKADLFLSLHRNSFTDKTANGVEVWTRYPGSQVAAGTVYGEVLTASGMKNRGMKVGSYLVLYELPMPAMLLELGFVSNSIDNTLFDNRFDQIAEAIAKGALTALGQPWNSVPTNPYWRVQVGAFASQSYAEAYKTAVTANGFPAFLVYYEDKKLWRVQVGAFGSKANAERYLKEVQRKYPAFLVAPDGKGAA